MSIRRVAGVGLAVLLAGVGTLGLVSYVQTARADAEAQGGPTPVVIVDKLVPKGADADTIAASTHEGTVQRRSKQPGALAGEGEIGDRTAAVDLLPGDQLVAGRLTAKRPVPTDKVQTAVKLEAERAVGGALKPDDAVDVYLSFQSDDPAAPNRTDMAFGSVNVTNIQTAEQTTDEQGAVKSQSYVVTLALLPEQSKTVVEAAEFGSIWLSRTVAN
jgi:pilus assembly protein CpaB